MVKRYIQIKDFAHRIDFDEVQALKLSDYGDKQVAKFMKNLSIVKYVTKKLEDPTISLAPAQTFFDGVTEKHPYTRSRFSLLSTFIGIHNAKRHSQISAVGGENAHYNRM